MKTLAATTQTSGAGTAGSGAAEPALIELNDVQRTFVRPGSQPYYALRGVSLRIAAGEHVAVLGKSGSGKSTLLNLIGGLDRPSAGRVQVAREDLSRLGENAIAAWRGRNVGIVFQFFQLLPTLTVSENILLAMDLVGSVAPPARRARADALLHDVGLAEHASKLPSMLSGGQQQRAAIARALANDPPIVLADEPTGNLDSETASDVAALFATLSQQGKTLLVVTHDSNLAQAARRVIQLKDGVLAADDSRAALPPAAQS